MDILNDRKFIVYRHTCPNNKVYIGITCNSPNRRWRKGKGYHHNNHFTNAIKKYGWDNIKHEILYKNLTKEEAEQKEIELITKYNLTDRRKGYNSSIGGGLSSLGHKVSKEARNKISQNNKGKTPWNKGVHLTEKQKDKLRDIANKRNLVGERNPFYGFKHTEDAKKKMSKSHKGKTTWNKGIPMKLESKEKMSKHILCVDTGVIYYGLSEASRQTGIALSNICNCCKGKRKTAGGYIWRYAND